METIRVPEAVQRLRGIFLEIPGTNLSLRDASRLASLEPGLCEHVLKALEQARFLSRASDGRYRRPSDDSTRPAKI